MRKLTGFSTFVLIFLFFVMSAQPAVALPTNPESMNARFVKWQEKPHVVHIFIHDDEGRSHVGPAMVAKKQPVLFGYEWSEDSIEGLQDFLDDSNHQVELSIDGGTWFSVKDWYQDPFVSTTQSGPAWSWDHDGDGPGDGDGDGFGDWDGPTLFFRYQSAGLPTGTHTFEFRLSLDGGTNWLNDLITVVAG